MAEINHFLSGLNIVPAGPGSGNTVSSSASANTYGAWVEFIASAAADTYITGLSHYIAATLHITYGQISIGIGTVGAESEKFVIVNRANEDSHVIHKTIIFAFPLKVPSGSRVAVRIADNETSVKTHSIHLHTILVSNVVSPVLAEVANPTGTVVSDGSNSTTTFKTDLSGADNYWNDCYLKFTSESLINQVKKITDFDGTTKFVTVSAFTGIPTAGATFEIINQ